MYKLPLSNLHNVQQYKLFGVLISSKNENSVIVYITPFAYVVPNLYGFLKCELKFCSGPHTKVLYGFRRLMGIFYNMKGPVPLVLLY